MAHTTHPYAYIQENKNKIALISPLSHAMLDNKIIQLLIGNSRIRKCNNLSEMPLLFNLIDRFYLTTMRPEYDSFTSNLPHYSNATL